MARVDQLAQGVGVGRQPPEAAAERIDEQDHQRAPQPVVDRAGHTIGIAGGGSGVERSGPDPGGRHAGGTDAEADPVVRDHEGVGVFLLLADAQGQQVGAAIKSDHQQDDRQGRKLVEGGAIQGQFSCWWNTGERRFMRAHAGTSPRKTH